MNTRITRLSIAVLGLVAVLPASAQLGISRNPAFVPAADAMLDVSVASLAANAKMGLLVPRMTAAQRIGISAAPATGLIVYQTTVPVGYWYYDGTTWVPVSNGNGWSLYGDALTTAANYVGTFDSQNFRLRTNGTQGVTITAGATPGRVGVNTATTNEMMEVNGGMLINGGAPTLLGGNIRGVPGVFPGTTVHQGYLGAPLNNWYQLENVFGERISQTYQSISPTCNYPVPALPNPNFISGAAGDFVTIGTGGAGSDGSSINTPYCTLWEDHRVHYLYTAAELAAVMPNGGGPAISICSSPYTIEGLAFNSTFQSAEPMQQAEIKMVNSSTTSLVAFNLTAMQTCWTSPSYVAQAGWNNIHQFSSPFAWNGSSNVIIEYCFNNNNWISSGSSDVLFDNTTYSALFGSYCDACGSIGAPGQCNFTACPPGTAVATGGVPCPGQSHQPGCLHTTGMFLSTCDGTFQWNGAQGTANKHPQLRLYCQVGSILIVLNTGDYIYTPKAVMIGTTAWAQGTGPFAFKGTGTISAQNQVWGGGLLLSDHVFDKYYDGQVKPEDATAAQGYQHRTVDEMASYVESNRHLPTVQGRSMWDAIGGFSVDQLNTDLWVTVEEQALHIKELNDRMELLQKYLIEKRLAELKK
ncbi:MAG: hypothetical protein ABI599_09800 [Flavobacteriales bacterium]